MFAADIVDKEEILISSASSKMVSIFKGARFDLVLILTGKGANEFPVAIVFVRLLVLLSVKIFF